MRFSIVFLFCLIVVAFSDNHDENPNNQITNEEVQSVQQGILSNEDELNDHVMPTDEKQHQHEEQQSVECICDICEEPHHEECVCEQLCDIEEFSKNQVELSKLGQEVHNLFAEKDLLASKIRNLNSEKESIINNKKKLKEEVEIRENEIEKLRKRISDLESHVEVGNEHKENSKKYQVLYEELNNDAESLRQPRCDKAFWTTFINSHLQILNEKINLLTPFFNKMKLELSKVSHTITQHNYFQQAKEITQPVISQISSFGQQLVNDNLVQLTIFQIEKIMIQVHYFITQKYHQQYNFVLSHLEKGDIPFPQETMNVGVLFIVLFVIHILNPIKIFKCCIYFFLRTLICTFKLWFNFILLPITIPKRIFFGKSKKTKRQPKKEEQPKEEQPKKEQPKKGQQSKTKPKPHNKTKNKNKNK